MPRYRTAYPPEFRRQMVDLVRSGRTPEELAGEFEPTAQSISTWVKQADRDAGKRIDGPTSAEREELARLRRETHRLRQERDILAKAAAWFAREEAAAMSDLIWLSDAQMRRIERHFPRSHGVPRVDDRRTVSGIIFLLAEQRGRATNRVAY
jgi:transposase